MKPRIASHDCVVWQARDGNRSSFILLSLVFSTPPKRIQNSPSKLSLCDHLLHRGAMKASSITHLQPSRFNPLCRSASSQRTSPPRTPLTPTSASQPNSVQTVKMSGRTFSLGMPTYDDIPSSSRRLPAEAPTTGNAQYDIASPNAGRTRTVTSAFQQARLTDLLAEVCAFPNLFRRCILIVLKNCLQTAFPTTAQREQIGQEIGMSGRRVQVSHAVIIPLRSNC